MKIILLPLFLISFGLNNNINNKQNDIFLFTTVNETLTTNSSEGETSENEIESYNDTETIVEEETNPVQEFIDDFITPILIIVAGMNVGSILTFLISIIVKKRKENETKQRQERLNTRIDELYDTFLMLLSSLKENQIITTSYSEVIKKISQKFTNNVEKLKKQHGNIEELENLILAIIVFLVKNNTECLANGTTEKVLKLIEDYKGE